MRKIIAILSGNYLQALGEIRNGFGVDGVGRQKCLGEFQGRINAPIDASWRNRETVMEREEPAQWVSG